MSSTSSSSSTVPATNFEQSSRIVKCRTVDGDIVYVEEGLLYQCGLFRQMYADLGMAEMDLEAFEMPLQMTSKMLEKVVDWCEHYKGQPEPIIEDDEATHERVWFQLDAFTKNFLESVPVAELVAMLVSANFLDLRSLYLYGAQTMAAKIRAAATSDEIRALLDQPDDLSAEEKDEISRENVWCNY